MTPQWPANLPRDQLRIRRAREHLVGNGLLASPASVPDVREIIERSWRRCVGEAVSPRPRDIPYRDVSDLPPKLREAAIPVLDRIGDQLNDVRVALVLSDRTGRIIARRVSEPQQYRIMDNACAAEGFDYSEGSIGTNGLGTVLTERRPVLVHGAEHYNETLEPLTCAGIPICEPFTGKLLGTFALTCHAVDASALMCAMASDIGRQIEGNLTAMLGARERALINAYLATESGREPVIVVTEGSAFANTAGLVHLSADTHALLWTHLSEAGLRRGDNRVRVPLPSGWWEAVVENIDDSAAHSAFCLRLLGTAASHEEPARRNAGTPTLAAPPVHPLPDVDRELITPLNFGECLAVDGPPGSGKLHAASAAITRLTGLAPVVVDFSAADPESWTDAVAAGHGVVFRHLQDVPACAVNRVKAMIEQAGDPVAVTVDLACADERVQALVAQLCTMVRLPNLREMPDQIPALVKTFLAERPLPQRPVVSSDAMRLLMRWAWPGNIAELRRTVEFLASRLPGKIVGVRDLPSSMQHTGSRELTLMESAERDTIITALRRAGGNRTKAAQTLGIGRTTLYRKLQAHHIEA